jgi:hypothetical protein
MSTFVIDRIGLPLSIICQQSTFEEPLTKRKFKASCGTILIFAVTPRQKIKNLTRDSWGCTGCDNCRQLEKNARKLLTGS